MVDIDKLIAKAKAELDVVKVVPVDVTLGGERLALGIAKLTPDEWDDLVAECPMRPGVEGDALLGYNPKRACKLYPGVIIDDERLSVEKWGEIYEVLDSTWRNSVEVTIWGINVHEQLQELRNLGKVFSGKGSPSPEN